MKIVNIRWDFCVGGKFAQLVIKKVGLPEVKTIPAVKAKSRSRKILEYRFNSTPLSRLTGFKLVISLGVLLD